MLYDNYIPSIDIFFVCLTIKWIVRCKQLDFIARVRDRAKNLIDDQMIGSFKYKGKLHKYSALTYIN